MKSIIAENRQNKVRAPRNRTIDLTDDEIATFRKKLIKIDHTVSVDDIVNKTACQDTFSAFKHLPDQFVDLVFVDPPYNLDKTFNMTSFRQMESDKYEKWLDSWVSQLIRLLKPNASVYICGDWKCSGAIFNVARKYFNIQNRITWEREKGRGAKSNWKNCSEDIWFCTMSDNYYFNVEAVKLKRKVLAPYTDDSGKPKDWLESDDGRYRITFPSNMWTDLTVPFWSMPENTDHPTQKPEKLVAKIILANSEPNNIVFDPFLGSGTTSVIAKKLGRRYFGIELDEFYCCLAEKRLEMASNNSVIQGYHDGVFWERNSLGDQKKFINNSKDDSKNYSQVLF